MWTYEKEHDWYRHTEKPDYVVEVEHNKVFPTWTTFHVSSETGDFTRKLISTDLYSALGEADVIVHGGEPEFFKPYPNGDNN